MFGGGADFQSQFATQVGTVGDAHYEFCLSLVFRERQRFGRRGDWRVVGDQFDTYRYKLSVSGGYHAVGEFLTNVGSLTRIVSPVNVSITAAAQRTKNATSGLDARFVVQTYVSKGASKTRGGKS